MLAKCAPGVSAFTMQTEHVGPLQGFQNATRRPFYVVDHDKLRARVTRHESAQTRP